MNEQEFGSTPTGPGPSTTEGAAGWQTTPPAGYTQQPPPGYAVPPAAAATSGLSESAASALAYVTLIPAIIFLLVAPYNQSAKIRFHAIQELGLSIVMFVLWFFLIIPFLGWLIYIVGFVGLFIVWILCIIKASQGGAFKLPFIGDFAAKQSGYTP